MRPPRSTIFVVSDGPSSFVARRVARQFFFPPPPLLLLPSASARATHAAVLTRLAVLSASDSLAPKLLSIGFSSSAVAASTCSAGARAAAAAASVVAAALRTASPRPSSVPRVGASAVDEDPPRDDEGVSHDIVVVVVVVVVAARERPRGLRRDARAAGRGSATFMSATALDISRRTGARPSRCALTSQILGPPNCQIISFESRSVVIAEGTRGGHGGRE